MHFDLFLRDGKPQEGDNEAPIQQSHARNVPKHALIIPLIQIMQFPVLLLP